MTARGDALSPLSPVERHDASFGANCIGCSPRNPKGLALEFHPDGDQVVCNVCLGPDYEGYPGMVHGGIVALILDEVMGRAALWRARAFVMTVGMRIRYGTVMIPGRPYICRAGVTVHADGQLKGSAALETPGGELIASATGTFVAVSDAMLASGVASIPKDITDHVLSIMQSARTEPGAAP